MLSVKLKSCFSLQTLLVVIFGIGTPHVGLAQNISEPANATAQVSELTDAEQRALVSLDGEYGSEVEKRWRAALDKAGLAEGDNDRDVFIASGIATVAIEKGARGWIEARRFAHDIAYERAKAQLVSAMGQIVQREGSTEIISKSSFGQGSIQAEEDRLGQIARIRGKLGDLAEAELDQALSEVDPDYNPEKYQGKGLPELEVALQNLFEQSSYRAAASVVAGATTFRVIEGPTDDGLNHEILVGLVWSPRLASLAGAIASGRLPAQVQGSGAKLEDILPKTVGSAITALGTRVFVTENGERAILSFAQVEPAAVGAADQSQARRAALSTAEDIAIGQIGAFVGERIAFESETNSRQVTEVYADLVQRGVEINTEQLQTIRTATGRLEISGANTVWREVVQHPETEQDIAIAAVLWSPAGQQAASRIRTRMHNSETEMVSDTESGEEAATKTPEPGLTFESEGISSDAY